MTHSIETSGIKINYKDINSNRQDTIVFIHGNSHSARTFEPQLNSPELSKYRMIALDLPGHGESSKSDQYTIPFFSDILADFIQSLKLNNYLLVGHSLGGHIAIEALDRLNPKGIVIFGTPPVEEKFAPQLCFQAKEELGLIFKPNLTDEEALMVSDSFYSSKVENKIDLEDIQKTDPAFKVKLVESCANNILKNEVDLLQEFKGLISIFHGLYDNYLIKEYLTGLELPLWRSSLIEFKSGHNIHKESPAQFNTELNSFAQASFNYKRWNNTIL